MYDALLACCRWLEQTPWGASIRASSWLYPVVLWLHFAGLSVWLAAVVVVDVRLIGAAGRRGSAAELANALFPWNWIGLGVAALAGFLLLSAEATTYVTNTGFRLKLGVLFPLAVLSHLVVRKAAGKWAGSLELVLWISVVAASVGFLLTNAVTHP